MISNYLSSNARIFRLVIGVVCGGIATVTVSWAVSTSDHEPSSGEITLSEPGAPYNAPPVAQILNEIDRNTHVAITELQSSWMKALLDTRRYEDILTITDHAIFAEPLYTWAMSFLMESRIRAELGLGRPMEALQDAKRLYNVAPMAETNAAMLLFSQCLAVTYPNNPEIVRRFIKEQVEGSQTAGLSSSVLMGIKLDPSRYLGKYNLDPAVDSYLTGKGNLLLLAGEPQQALEVFQSASPSSKSAAGHHANVNDIARAMKARDGTIAAANDYLRAQAAIEVGK